jgi:hypothetical protein
VSSLKAEILKTQIGVGKELQVSIWHSMKKSSFMVTKYIKDYEGNEAALSYY